MDEVGTESYSSSVADLGPTSYAFAAYLTYPDTNPLSEPTLTIYRDKESVPEEADIEQYERLDIGFTLTVTRTVREMLGHRHEITHLYVADAPAATEALNRMERQDPKELPNAMKTCWRLADRHALKAFPVRYP